MGGERRGHQPPVDTREPVAPPPKPGPERWVDRATGERVIVLAREKTPNGWTIFKWEDGPAGREGRLRHPRFNEKFRPWDDGEVEAVPLPVRPVEVSRSQRDGLEEVARQMRRESRAIFSRRVQEIVDAWDAGDG